MTPQFMQEKLRWIFLICCVRCEVDENVLPQKWQRIFASNALCVDLSWRDNASFLLNDFLHTSQLKRCGEGKCIFRWRGSASLRRKRFWQVSHSCFVIDFILSERIKIYVTLLTLLKGVNIWNCRQILTRIMYNYCDCVQISLGHHAYFKLNNRHTYSLRFSFSPLKS